MLTELKSIQYSRIVECYPAQAHLVRFGNGKKGLLGLYGVYHEHLAIDLHRAVAPQDLHLLAEAGNTRYQQQKSRYDGKFPHEEVFLRSIPTQWLREA